MRRVSAWPAAFAPPSIASPADRAAPATMTSLPLPADTPSVPPAETSM
jgi:hypothetical protein